MTLGTQAPDICRHLVTLERMEIQRVLAIVINPEVPHAASVVSHPAWEYRAKDFRLTFIVTLQPGPTVRS